MSFRPPNTLPTLHQHSNSLTHISDESDPPPSPRRHHTHQTQVFKLLSPCCSNQVNFRRIKQLPRHRCRPRSPSHTTSTTRRHSRSYYTCSITKWKPKAISAQPSLKTLKLAQPIRVIERVERHSDMWVLVDEYGQTSEGSRGQAFHQLVKSAQYNHLVSDSVGIYTNLLEELLQTVFVILI
jgi:hypothetical protein